MSMYVYISDKLTLCRTAPGYFNACGSVYLELICVGSLICEQNEHSISPPHFLAKNHSKIDQKSIQNRSKIHEKSILGASRGPRPFVLLFWWVLGAFCGPQEANMAATGDPRWSPNRIKIKSKMEAKNRCVLDGHIRRFFQILGPNLAPKWRQVGHRKRFVGKFN